MLSPDLDWLRLLLATVPLPGEGQGQVAGQGQSQSGLVFCQQLLLFTRQFPHPALQFLQAFQQLVSLLRGEQNLTEQNSVTKTELKWKEKIIYNSHWIGLHARTRFSSSKKVLVGIVTLKSN